MSLLKQCLFIGALSASLTAFILPEITVAQNENREFFNFAESARGLGMGGAVTALAEGSDAFLYNPAGLAQSDFWKVEVAGWEESSNNQPQKYFADLDEAAGSTLANAQSFIDTRGNSAYSVRSQVLASIHNATGWGIAGIDSRQIQSVPDPATGGIVLRTDRIRGGMMTLAWSSEFKQLLFGISVKGLTRTVRERTVFASNVIDPDFQVQGAESRGSGIATDVGVMMRLPIPFLRPTLAVAALNVGEPNFGLTNVNPLKSETNVGLTLFPDIFSEWMRLILSADIRDSGKNAFDTSERKRRHFGGEISFFPLDDRLWGLELRAGQSQGFASFGGAINLSHFLSVSYVRYKEDLGTQDLPDPQIRELLEIKIGF